eukprot:Lankesteria_metandrocarpae@DN5205_c0_g1_i1.p1
MLSVLQLSQKNNLRVPSLPGRSDPAGDNDDDVYVHVWSTNETAGCELTPVQIVNCLTFVERAALNIVLGKGLAAVTSSLVQVMSLSASELANSYNCSFHTSKHIMDLHASLLTSQLESSISVGDEDSNGMDAALLLRICRSLRPVPTCVRLLDGGIFNKSFTYHRTVSSAQRLLAVCGRVFEVFGSLVSSHLQGALHVGERLTTMAAVKAELGVVAVDMSSLYRCSNPFLSYASTSALSQYPWIKLPVGQMPLAFSSAWDLNGAGAISDTHQAPGVASGVARAALRSFVTALKDVREEVSDSSDGEDSNDTVDTASITTADTESPFVDVYENEGDLASVDCLRKVRSVADVLEVFVGPHLAKGLVESKEFLLHTAEYTRALATAAALSVHDDQDDCSGAGIANQERRWRPSSWMMQQARAVKIPLPAGGPQIPVHVLQRSFSAWHVFLTSLVPGHMRRAVTEERAQGLPHKKDSDTWEEMGVFFWHLEKLLLLQRSVFGEDREIATLDRIFVVTPVYDGVAVEEDSVETRNDDAFFDVEDTPTDGGHAVQQRDNFATLEEDSMALTRDGEKMPLFNAVLELVIMIVDSTTNMKGRTIRPSWLSLLGADVDSVGSGGAPPTTVSDYYTAAGLVDGDSSVCCEGSTVSLFDSMRMISVVIRQCETDLATTLASLSWLRPLSDKAYWHDWITEAERSPQFPLSGPIKFPGAAALDHQHSQMASMVSFYEESRATQLSSFHSNPSFIWLQGTRVYYLLAQLFPAAIRRSWENSKNASAKRFVDQITRQHITPRLIANELATAQHAAKFMAASGCILNVEYDRYQRRLTARVLHGGEEVAIDLVLTFSDRHPLRVPGVTLEHMFGLPKSRLLNWRLACLRSLSGEDARGVSVFDVLWAFCENICYFFEGLDDCPICFSVIHLQSRTLPRKMCSTCKAKFHADCIHRWFRTSKKLTCPLCASLF